MLITASYARTRAARVLASDASTWRWTAVVFFAAFALTAHWQVGQVNDAQAAIWPAWHLIHAGTFDLAGAVGLPDLPWFHDVDGRIVSDRTAGVILAGVPFAVASAPFGFDPLQTGALAAATYSALAVANVHVLLRSVVPTQWAAAGAVTVGVGTPLWTTAAAELWTHGPNAFWLSLAMLMAARGRYSASGLFFGAAIMTRPHLAVAALAVGVTLSAARRSIRPAVLLGVPASAGLLGVVAWNSWYFRSRSIGGGTYESRMSSVTAAPDAAVARQLIHDAAGAFLSPATGLFVYTPLAGLLMMLVVIGWRRSPAWARGAFLGAIAYQVVQLRLNRYSGGGGFYSNRLVVEFVVLAAPLWCAGAHEWARRADRRRVEVLVALASAGVAIHAFGAVNTYYWYGTSSHWYIWYPKVVLDAAGVSGWITAGLLCLIPVVAVLFVRRHRDEGAPRPAPVPEQRASAQAEPPPLSSAAPAPPPGAAASPRR